MQSVELRSVSRVYDRLFALHRVSAKFEAGTVTGLVGDNGSGKTTLLSLLATIEKPTDGTIEYDEVGWETFSEQFRERIGWIAHDSLLYDELTGRENLEFYASMYGVGDGNPPEEWLERVGLEEDADRRLANYSRGMRQRLAIARALLHDPDLLLLDEPLTGLDRRGREAIIDLFGQLKRRQKLVVLASHDLRMLDELADCLLVLRRGKLSHFQKAIGEGDRERSVAELYREYA